MKDVKFGVVKTKVQLDDFRNRFNGEGWLLKGQFFPTENLELSGKTFEFTKQWNFCWTTVINGQYRFISEEAIIFE